jgi:hypothetical protein
MRAILGASTFARLFAAGTIEHQLSFRAGNERRGRECGQQRELCAGTKD